MEWRTKVELFEQIRREYEFGVGTISGVAKKLNIHRRMVREAIGSALPMPRKKVERPRWKLAAAIAFVDQILETDKKAPRKQRQGVLRGGLAVSAWCENKKFRLEDIQPIRVAGYVEQLMQTHSKPTIKQHLAAIRMLFDWLVTGQVIPLNRAHSVRGPRHSVKKGKTSLLSAEEMRPLLDSIETSKLIGLRDRALIALMGYTFARVGAAVQMKVEDY